MKKCWASVLGGCNSISKEHITSHSVTKHLEFNNLIAFYGAPWSEDKAVVVGKNALTSKILCRKHNSMLSPLDAEAGKMAEMLDEYFSMIVEEKVATQDKEINLDGNLIERWFLKTAINRLQWHYPAIKNIPLELVEIVYGQRKFPDGVGLTNIWYPSKMMHIPKSLGGIIDIDILNNQNQPEFVAFNLWAYMFVIPLTTNPVPDKFTNMKIKIPNQIGMKFLMKTVTDGVRNYHQQVIGYKSANGKVWKMNLSWD